LRGNPEKIRPFQFKKGESGNPKGRPPDVIKALQKQSRTMEEVLRQYEADPRLVYKVAEAILNRAIYGGSDTAWMYLIKNVGIL
jgi:hypothetical protein